MAQLGARVDKAPDDRLSSGWLSCDQLVSSVLTPPGLRPLDEKMLVPSGA
jgi:hypothetical protein